jgi:hypothetical protein
LQVGPVPQRHEPLAQLSARGMPTVGMHWTQRPPFEPQASTLPTTQSLAVKQQPLVHEEASHTQLPFTQCDPELQA